MRSWILQNCKFAQSQDMLGNCRDEALVESMFGSVSEFARQIEENGDNFVYGNIKVVYDPKTDIHTFYKITLKTYAWVHKNCRFAQSVQVTYDDSAIQNSMKKQTEQYRGI
jgi:hypothetical protein